jgi:hypothetical protein
MPKWRALAIGTGPWVQTVITDCRDPLVRRPGLLCFGARPPAETRATHHASTSTDLIQWILELGKATVCGGRVGRICGCTTPAQCPICLLIYNAQREYRYEICHVYMAKRQKRAAHKRSWLFGQCLLLVLCRGFKTGAGFSATATSCPRTSYLMALPVTKRKAVLALPSVQAKGLVFRTRLQ